MSRGPVREVVVGKMWPHIEGCGRRGVVVYGRLLGIGVGVRGLATAASGLI